MIINKILTVGFVLLTMMLTAQNNASIIHEGHYQGKNLYVQNPFADAGIGFCVIKVTVNGQKPRWTFERLIEYFVTQNIDGASIKSKMNKR